jgi:Flp pilus assembly protein TadD
MLLRLLINFLFFVGFLYGGMAVADDCEERHAALVRQYVKAAAKPANTEAYFEGLLDLEDSIFAQMNHCPDDVQLLSLMGETQIAMGRFQLAVLYGRKVVKMAPDIWRTHALLGGSLVSLREYEEGISHLQQASKMAPQNIKLKLNLCSAYASAGRRAKAIQVCDEVIRNADSDVRRLATAIRKKLDLEGAR